MSSSTSAHVHLELVQLIRECLHESLEPHIPHAEESAICLCDLTSSVGKECLESLHKNILTLAGTCTFQSFFHELDSPAEFEVPEDPSSQASLRCFIATRRLYADLTENIPRLSKCQLQESCNDRVHSGIPRITRASMGMNTSSTRALSQDAVVWLMSSDTSVGGFGTQQP